MQLNLSTAKTYATRAIACLQVGALYLVGTAAFSFLFLYILKEVLRRVNIYRVVWCF